MDYSYISDKAKIHSTVKIGPFCIIGPNVEIEEGCILKSHVSISGNTKIGKNNIFYPFSSIGSEPQDLKYKGEESFLIIGSNNTFRENVTVNPGTEGGGLKTKIENNCLFMVGSHIAHDCKIGSNVILANNATLAGHVALDDNSIIGGNSAIHQFVKIGKNAMVGGMSGLEKNLIPYGLYIGIRSNMKGINLVGLKRKGLDNNKIKTINNFVESIFNNNDAIENNLNKVDSKIKSIQEVKEIIEFIELSNKRGLVTL